MADSVRWYDSDLDSALLRKLGEAMLRDEYTARRTWGFRVSECNRHQIDAQYFEKVTRVDEITDPLGVVTRYERHEFRTVPITVRVASPSIEIRGARSVGDLFKRIAEYSSYKVVVAPIRIPVRAWWQALEARVRAEVVGLDVADIALTADSKALLRLSSSTDVRGAFDKFVAKRSHRISRVVVRWRHRQDAVSCEMREGGRAKVTSGEVGPAIDVLRAALTDAASVDA